MKVSVCPRRSCKLLPVRRVLHQQRCISCFPVCAPSLVEMNPWRAVSHESVADLKVQSCLCSVTLLCPTLCDPTDCSTPGLPVLHYLPDLAQTHVHWVSDAIQPSHPPSPLLLLPSVFPSIRDFSNELAFCIRWPKYWSFNFRISPSNEYSGLISFRIDLSDLLSVRGTLKSLLQNHSSEISVLWCSVFFMVQLSHPYMTSGKTIGLTILPFVGKVMSLLFNMLSRFA